MIPLYKDRNAKLVAWWALPVCNVVKGQMCETMYDITNTAWNMWTKTFNINILINISH